MIYKYDNYDMIIIKYPSIVFNILSLVADFNADVQVRDFVALLEERFVICYNSATFIDMVYIHVGLSCTSSK